MASIRVLKSGNYQVQIRLQGLPNVSRTFKTKKNAMAFAREVEANTELHRKLGKSFIDIPTFSQIVDEYMLKYQGHDVSKQGHMKYWCSQLGDLPIDQIDEYIVDDCLVEIASRRTGSTVNRYKSALSAIFIYFIQHPKYKRLGLTNPVRKESVSSFPENAAKNRFLNDYEQIKLIEASKASHWEKMHLLVLLALTTGARKGELLGLKWSDIDFINRTACLLRTKNGNPRLLPLTRKVIECLIQFRSEGLIFPSTKNSNVPFEITKAWKKTLEKADIQNCRFHDLRHTAASNLVKVGRTLYEVSILLGHSSTTMTERYSHLAINDTIEMVDCVMGGLGNE